MYIPDGTSTVAATRLPVLLIDEDMMLTRTHLGNGSPY